MDGNVNSSFKSFINEVKIRPLMDGNKTEGLVDVYETDVKIRPLMDGNNIS